jgi:hypothetical protein
VLSHHSAQSSIEQAASTQTLTSTLKSCCNASEHRTDLWRIKAAGIVRDILCCQFGSKCFRSGWAASPFLVKIPGCDAIATILEADWDCCVCEKWESRMLREERVLGIWDIILARDRGLAAQHT